ncbi:MAG: hypothetical protein ABEJ57_05175 [Halobacteriaceae archaeon]
MPSRDRLAKHGLIGGVALLVAGYATMTVFWYGYQQANPAIGTVSTSPGFLVLNAVLFVTGIAAAYTAFARGLTD